MKDGGKRKKRKRRQNSGKVSAGRPIVEVMTGRREVDKPGRV